MSDEQDSFMMNAFGVDLGQSLQRIKDEASAAIGQAASTVTQVVQGAQDVVEGAISEVTGAVTGAAKKVAGVVSGSPSAGASGGGTGSFPLGGSVGSGGQNAANDVKAVQAALGIAADGKCGGQTIAAIEAFQRNMGLAKPDGRVDAGGGTERALAGGAKPAATPTPPPAQEADDSGGLLGQVQTGAAGLVPTNAGILETAEAALIAAGEVTGVSGAVRKVEKTAEQAGSIVADDPVAAVAGLAFGAVQGVAPGGFLLGSPKPESKAFELGRGVGLIGGGIAVVAAGAGAEVGGIALDATGVGAVVGVPVNILGAAAIASGVVSVGAGVVTVGGVLATGGGGPQPPKANPEEALKEARQNLNVAFAEEEAARKANLEATQKFVRFANEPNPDPVVLKQLEGEADRAGQAGVEALKKLQAAEQAELDAIIRANQARGRGGFPPPR